MRFVIQRVTDATLSIEGKPPATIGPGLVVLLGIHQNDDGLDCERWIDKILKLRVFGDDEGKMNLSVKDIKGELLLVSQFTLFADCKGQNRPSFLDAAKPDKAIPLYERFVSLMKEKMPGRIQTGEFGAHMAINLTNDGPVTIILE